MLYPVYKKVLLLFYVFIFNKLLLTLITKEQLIIAYLTCLKHTQGIMKKKKIRKSLFGCKLTSRYNSLVRNKFIENYSSIRFRGTTNFKIHIRGYLILLFYLENIINKILFDSIIFSECLYSKNCTKISKFLLQNYFEELD